MRLCSRSASACVRPPSPSRIPHLSRCPRTLSRYIFAATSVAHRTSPDAAMQMLQSPAQRVVGPITGGRAIPICRTDIVVSLLIVIMWNGPAHVGRPGGSDGFFNLIAPRGAFYVVERGSRPLTRRLCEMREIYGRTPALENANQSGLPGRGQDIEGRASSSTKGNPTSRLSCCRE